MSAPLGPQQPQTKVQRWRPVLPRMQGNVLMRTLLGLLVLAAVGAALAWWVVGAVGVPPRLLAPYIARRAAGHNPTIVAVGERIAAIMLRNDRGPVRTPQPMSLRLGAQPAAAPREPTGTAPGASRVVPVASAAALLAAIDQARAGDVDTIAPGTYRLHASYIAAHGAGTAAAPITVRAAQPGTVLLELDAVEGFLVSAPYWQFENLGISGVCADDSDCEHAFHVVGKASHFVARNNTVRNFNAHFKINAVGQNAPDAGILEANTLTNDAIRRTANPVTLIDLVAASDWIIRKNFLSDFFKGDGDQVSYGAYAKGGGSNNVFENNVVLCEYLLRSPHGARVGLSLGGGGTGAAFCRAGVCHGEQDHSLIRANLIANCADVGIYLNRAADSRIIHNTLVDTGGIAVRYPESTAYLEGNLVDGAIHGRDGATLTKVDNIDTATARLYLGSHPMRQLLASPGNAFGGRVPRRTGVGTVVPDLCATAAIAPTTEATPAYGAFANFANCMR